MVPIELAITVCAIVGVLMLAVGVYLGSNWKLP